MSDAASLSLDLDNAWSYLKTRGDASWQSYPSYLDVVVPRALDVLAAAGLRITFFVVGTDAEREPEQIAALAAAGHEVENHSHRHEPWLDRYAHDELAAELDQAEAAITAATGVAPTAFRGPGYTLSAELLRSLRERGYRYDASTLPTWIGPLARAYYFRTAKLDAGQRAERSKLFGTVADARWPVTPYRFEDADGLIELPVTTLPGLRVPIHLSYVLYLQGFSPPLARRYFRTALATCHRVGVEPSILLHPLDLIGADDLGGTALEFFPGMGLDGLTKRQLLLDCLAEMTDRFEVLTLGEHVTRLAARPLPVRPVPDR